MNKLTYDDDDCLQDLKQGNTFALQYLIKIYFPVLCLYSFKITSNRLQSEDITEETLIKVWERHTAFKTTNELKGFLYTTVRNMSLNALRSKQRELKRISFLQNEDSDMCANDLVYEEMLAEIRKSLQKISPKLRQIFILSYFKKLNNHQIAETLNISEQTVRNQKSKALTLLKKMLSDKVFYSLLLI